MSDSLILPENITHDFFIEVMECVLERQKRRIDAKDDVPPLTIYCCSSGGESRPSLAIVNAIRTDGNVIGILIGAAVSSAATIWAACQTRIVHPGTRLGIHPVAWNGVEGVFNHKRLGAVSDEFKWIDEEQCRIYAAASNKSLAWWWDRYVKTPEMEWIGADELIAIGMAKMWNNGQQPDTN